MDQPGADVIELISRFHTEFAVRMTGFDSVGNPIPPPDSHVLDHLARAWDLTDVEGAGDRPAAGTVVCPIEELECELCGARARYESPLVIRGQRVRVELCLECMRERGDPVLGGSGSVYFMYFDEVSAAVRAVCDGICTRKGRASIWGGPTTAQADTGGGSSPTTPVGGRASDPPPLGAVTVAVRLRRLWLDEFGPAFDEHDHDLAEVWRDCAVRRLGPDLVVTGQISFGDGDPFADQFSQRLAARLTERTRGSVRALRYEHSERPLKTPQRSRTSNLDVFHPADLTVPIEKTANGISARLAGASNPAKVALSGLHLAAVSRHRIWFAAASAEVKATVGKTPGAAGELALAVKAVQRKDPLYDIFVDSEAASLPSATALVRKGH
ncbi:hypothetical protein ASF47_04210 [Nocardioides sp. Leaf285]|nr:hypothetical protein ASF47_04210 [Nocardioides sp. Leaf285]